MYALLWLNSDLHMINYVLFLATWAFNYNGKLAAHLTCCNSHSASRAHFATAKVPRPAGLH